jgi:hypothetical protein
MEPGRPGPGAKPMRHKAMLGADGGVRRVHGRALCLAGDVAYGFGVVAVDCGRADGTTFWRGSYSKFREPLGLTKVVT